MSDTALKARGIEDADTGALLVGVIARPSAGRADLNVKNGTQPLGRPEGLHAIKLLVEGYLRVFPEMSDTVATVVDKARDHVVASETEARS